MKEQEKHPAVSLIEANMDIIAGMMTDKTVQFLLAKESLAHPNTYDEYERLLIRRHEAFRQWHFLQSLVEQAEGVKVVNLEDIKP